MGEPSKLRIYKKSAHVRRDFSSNVSALVTTSVSYDGRAFLEGSPLPSSKELVHLCADAEEQKSPEDIVTSGVKLATYLLPTQN